MDVFVWFNDDDEIISYQFTYNKPQDEKALVWSKEKGFSHLSVDDGAHPGKHPGSPIFVADGAVSPTKLISMLDEDEGDLEPQIKRFIISGIERHFN